MPDAVPTPAEELKLLGEMEADALWGRANYIEGSIGRILAEKEIKFCGWVRTLEKEHRAMREALKFVEYKTQCLPSDCGYCIAVNLKSKEVLSSLTL